MMQRDRSAGLGLDEVGQTPPFGGRVNSGEGLSDFVIDQKSPRVDGGPAKQQQPRRALLLSLLTETAVAGTTQNKNYFSFVLLLGPASR